MPTVAKLASRLNWPKPALPGLPCFFLPTDANRLADPTPVLARLPRGAAIIVRHPDAVALEALATRIVAPAHRMGLKVLVAGDVRLALRVKADGVHLSERRARLGPLRVTALPPGFVITAAAHDHLGLARADRAGAQLALLSPVYATQSHVDRPALGALRFASIARTSRLPVIALGGITAETARRLALGPAVGIAAIGGWRA